MVTPQGTGSGTQYAGYFAGDVTVTGTFSNPSDAKFKKNVRKVDSQLAKIKSLNPVSYEMKTKEFSSLNLGIGTQMGFIAQEVETIFPELVTENVQAKIQDRPILQKTDIRSSRPHPNNQEVKYKGINSIGLIPILTKGIQELSDIIDDKENEISLLKQQLDEQAEEINLLKLQMNEIIQKMK